MKVLLAEDQAHTRLALETALNAWGHDVVAVSDGGTALKVLQDDAGPRLAILDWVMPGLDGLQVCRKVRALEHQPYAYLILLTAKTDKEDILAGLRAGADDYLVKPVDLNELEARINT